MRELLFGTAYYPEYMPYDRVETDMRMMKNAGMNVVRIAESTWSTLEPQDGQYEFGYIDAVLRQAKKLEMCVIIGTPTYAIPSWLEKKDPTVMVEAREGRQPYGRRQIMDIMNPTYRYHGERIIRKLLEHTADCPDVIGFQIDNETKHYGNSSSAVQKLFLQSMKDKFGSVQAFNKAFVLPYWSNSIHSWEDFPDLRGCCNGGLAAEFESFQRSLAEGFLGWQASLVNQYKRADQFVTHNFDFAWKKFGADIAQDGYSYGVQPDLCHADAVRHVTIAGTDIYHPTQDELSGAETAFCGDSIRSLRHDNYLVLECQAQAFKYWTPYKGQLRLQAYAHLASGAAGTLYWNWHSIHNGYETYWKGLLSHDLLPNAAYEEACRIGREWGILGDKIKLAKKNQAAIVIDNHSLTAFKWFPMDKDLSYNDVVRWMYDSLYEMNIECDIVDASQLDTSRYKMIITPALYSADEKLLQSLKQFVNDGGVLISSFKSFVSDRNLTVYPDMQPHMMCDCFGFICQQYTDPGKMTLKGHPVKYIAELLQSESAEVLASYEHKYWGAYAGITKNRFGSGAAYYIGCYTDKETLKELYRSAAEVAQIPVPDMGWPLTLRSGVTAEGRHIHYLMNYSEDRQHTECPYTSVTDLLTGKLYHAGEQIWLEDWDLVILEEN